MNTVLGKTLWVVGIAQQFALLILTLLGISYLYHLTYIWA